MVKEFISPFPTKTLHLTLSLKEEEPKSYKCSMSIWRLRFFNVAYLESRIYSAIQPPILTLNSTLTHVFKREEINKLFQTTKYIQIKQFVDTMS